MAYEVFARKYRPKTWDDVVGQDATAKALRRAVATGRTASVYLFAGSHGVGKTSIARILAKSLDCPNAKEGAPCGTCDTCTAIERGECLDVVEIDAASHRGVDDAERLRENVRYKPASCPFKVYILDEVHQLSRQAFDALLKTFEEAPPLVRFVLATTELHKVPSTILGRTQVFRFRRAGLADIARRLGEISKAEGIVIDDGALTAIARRARGSLRDSQKILDQVVALAEGKIAEPDVARLLGDAGPDRVARCLAAIAKGEAAPLLDEVNGHVADGGRLEALAQDLLDGLRGVLYLKVAGRESPLLDEVALAPEDLAPAADALSEDGLLFAVTLLEDATQRMRQSREPRVVLEAVLVRLARARDMLPVGEVLARLERLEARLASGAPAPTPARPAPEPKPAEKPAARPTYGYPRSVAPTGKPPSTTSSSSGSAEPDIGGGGARAGGELTPRGQGGAPAPEPAPRLAPIERPAAPAPPPRQDPTSAADSVPRPALETAVPAHVAPAAPGPAPDVAIDLERIAREWPKIVTRLCEGDMRHRRLFERAQPTAYASGRVTVTIDLGDKGGFLASELDRPETRESVEAVLREVLGAKLDAKLERGAGSKPAAAAPEAPGAAAPKTRSVYDEPIVKFAQRELGGQATWDG